MDFVNNPVEKGPNLVRIGQHAGAPFLVGYHGIGTAQVPVDGVIPQVIQVVGQNDKIRCGFAQNLRNNRHAGVVFRKDVFDVFSLDAVILFAGDERSHRQVEPAEMVCKQTLEQMIGKPLHGGHV